MRSSWPSRSASFRGDPGLSIAGGEAGSEREDGWATLSTQRATGVSDLLALVKGRNNVVELGTASGWTSAALALADDERTVTTFDRLIVRTVRTIGRCSSLMYVNASRTSNRTGRRAPSE